MILVLIGRSGAGKSAIANILKKKYGYEIVVTATTRDRREGESEDAYHFMSDEEFRDHLRADDFVECDKYGDKWYGTLKSSLVSENNLVCAITPEGAEAIKKMFPDAYVVCVEVSPKTSIMRAIAREEELDPAKMQKISLRGSTDYYLFNKPKCDCVIENPEGADIEEVARAVAMAHEDFIELLKPMTNFDKIKNLSMEEMAKFNVKSACAETEYITSDGSRFPEKKDAEEYELKWLAGPATQTVVQ